MSADVAPEVSAVPRSEIALLSLQVPTQEQGSAALTAVPTLLPQGPSLVPTVDEAIPSL